jgi:peptidoglycan/LPS O-acetylase OafA/YrhL
MDDDARGFAYRPALDGLRAVAVLSVVAYHLGYGWAKGGFLGVDTFFVLSGFLITSLLLAEQRRGGAVRLAAFWARRARRLLPAVIVLVAALAATSDTWATPSQLRTLRGDALATLGYVANWRLVVSGQSYFELFAAPSPLRHMWSLAIEEQFYVAWPLVVAGAIGLARGRRRLLVVVCVAGVLASSAAMAWRYSALDPSRAYYGTDTRAHLLLVGALLALAAERTGPVRPRAARLVGWAGTAAFAGMLACVALVDDRASFMYRGGFLGYALLAALVVAAAADPAPSPIQRALSWRPARAVGVISYGVYLWHWPVQVVLTPARAGFDGAALDALRVATTFAVAAASYVLVERPVRYGRVPVRVALAGAPAALGLAGVLVLATTAAARPTPPELDATAPITAPPAPPTSAGGPAADPPGAPPGTIAVVGDSVASTIAWGLEAAAARDGIRVVSSAFPGCGVASGFALADDGTAFEWSAPCAQNVPGVLRELVDGHEPDVVVWYSTWELADRREDGEHLRYGSAAHTRALRRALDDAVETLTARGARLALLTVVPRTDGEVARADADADGEVAAYNALLRRVAASHAGVEVVDLFPLVCPGGPPCPVEVGGERLRPDGGHYTRDTSPWLGERLLPLLVG